jgi:hypothetical protein
VDGACSTHARDNSNVILVGKPEGKRSLGRHCRRWDRWENNIRLDLREKGEGVDWMHQARDGNQRRATLKSVMKRRFHKSRGTSWVAE